MDLHHCNSIQSEQHNIRHDKRERMFRNRMLTMHIAQILVRFGGFFPQAAGAMRYFPENALHEYHKEVSTPRQITRPCTRQPLAAEVRLRAHSITSILPTKLLCSCSTALELFSWPGWPAEKRQKTPGVSNVRKFKIAKFWDPAVCEHILPICEDVRVFSLNTENAGRGLGSLVTLAGTNYGLGRLNVLQPGQKHSGIPKPWQRP